MTRYTKKTVINKLKELNYIIVNEDEYLQNENITTNYRTNIKCLIHDYTWKSTIGEAYRNAKICQICRMGQNKSWEDYANEKNYKILNINNDNATFQCEFEHESWTTKKSNIMFTNCKECNGKIILEMVLKKLDKLKFELLNQDEYNTSRTIGKFKCSSGHIWECQIHNVYSGKSECPECGTNLAESKCKFILETIFNKKFIKTRKVIDTGLELDMYNEELNLALEYNGIQHFIEHEKFFHKHGGFEEQQDRDNYKLNFCLNNNINLIIVPYTVKGDKLIEFIYNKLIEFNYIIPNFETIDWDTKFTGYTMNSDNKNTIFNNMKQYAIDNGGKCLETHYLGYDTKHSFECNKKHKFKFDGREFVRRQTNKSFCVYCDGKKIDYEYLVELLAGVNMKAISTEYVNSGKTPFTIACNTCNTEFTSVWDNLKQRQVKNGCNNCNKIEELNEKLKNIEYKFADLIYKDANTKHNYSCPNGHIINKTWNAIKVQKGKCKECK